MISVIKDEAHLHRQQVLRSELLSLITHPRRTPYYLVRIVLLLKNNPDRNTSLFVKDVLNACKDTLPAPIVTVLQSAVLRPFEKKVSTIATYRKRA